MKAAYTPGPWEVVTYHGPLFGIVRGYNSATNEAPAYRTQADARLISAAPELYAVAELILAEWEKPTEGVERGELIARLSQYSTEARAALAKARGEP
jgi:hypothetical protein